MLSWFVAAMVSVKCVPSNKNSLPHIDCQCASNFCFMEYTAVYIWCSSRCTLQRIYQLAISWRSIIQSVSSPTTQATVVTCYARENSGPLGGVVNHIYSHISNYRRLLKCIFMTQLNGWLGAFLDVHDSNYVCSKRNDKEMFVHRLWLLYDNNMS